MTSTREIRSVFYYGLCIFLVLTVFEFVFYNKVIHKFLNKNNKVKQDRWTKISAYQKKSNKVLSYARINVIMAYMRTGSTFVASTLQEYPKTFYFYEPTRSIWRKFMDQSNPITEILYPNGTKKRTDKTQIREYILREITNYMTCSLDDITVTSLSGKEHRRTNEMIKLWLCTKENINNTREHTALTHSANWTQCLEEARYKCLNSNARLFKFIRIRMSDIKTLFPKFPNMRILYLNRDPRGIFHSRDHMPEDQELSSFRDVNKHCNDWLEDIEEVRDLVKAFPGRIRTIRYEDIAQDNANQFIDICAFFGIEFTREIETYLKNITSGGEDGGIWEVKRADPYKTSQRWRSEMKFKKANFISKICEIGMREFNYCSFKSEKDMRNLDLPARANCKVEMSIKNY